MLQEIEQISPTTKKLKINIPTDVIKTETDSVYNKLRTTTKIPGFRPGKAPQSILEKKYSKNVEAEVIEKIVPEFYIKAIKEANLEPISYPQIDDKIELVSGQSLTFTVIVEVKPEIGELKYEGIELNEKTFTVADDEVEKTLNLMQESKALYTVTEETLNENDMAIINSEAFIDDKLQDGLSYTEYPLLLNTDAMPKEFIDAIVGRKKGDAVDVKIRFENDIPNKTLAGKEVLFKVQITEAKKKNVPPLDDDFAKEANCGSLEELNNKIRVNLTEMKKSQANLEYKKDILNELIKRHSFDVPDSMLQGEIESLIYKAKQDAEKKGETLKPEVELKRDFETTAKDNVKSVILLEAIGKKEKIEATEDDVKKAIAEIAARNDLKPEEVTKLYSVREGSMDALKSRLFADKVLDFILDKAVIQS